VGHMKYFIITGTSKGLGFSAAKQLITKGHTIFCISRKQNNELKNMAAAEEVNLYYFSCDLQKPEEIERVVDKIFTAIDFSDAEGIYLVNNAGVVDPIKPVGKASTSELITNVRVNLLAPMVLSDLFIRNTISIPTNKVIVNVSSGAANRPVYGWSSYCSTKAGIDMFTRTAGLEQTNEQYPVTVISFSPGVMDTDMQSTIRQSDKDDFTDVDEFIRYNEKGMLRSTEYVAETLIALLFHKQLENGEIYDIKQLL